MQQNEDIERFDKIHNAILKGIEKAIKEHQKAGRAIVVWRNNRVEKIPPDEIDDLED